MNFRNFIGMSALGIAALTSLQAGTIQTELGGTHGLTNAYVTGNCGGTCVTGSLTGTTLPTEVNYDSTVFSGAKNGSVAPTPYVGYGTGSGGTLTDAAGDGGSGVTFAMINDTSSSSNAWFMPSAQASSSAVTIPVGILGVTDIWTLTNTMEAAALGRDLTINLVFGPTATSASTTTVVIRPIDTNSPAGASALNTDQNAVDCTGGAGCTGTGAGSTNGAVGAAGTYITTPGSSAGQVSSSGVGGAGVNGVTINADTVFSSLYNTATGAYANTSGNVVLDDQGFMFTGALATFAANNYLESIVIKDNGTTAGSGVFLSAVTVDSASSTPEPSTIFMLLSGLGAIGLSRIRRR
jgi:PEP-CTERM motif